MTRRRLQEDPELGLRLAPAPPVRAFGEDRFTWVQLLYSRLLEVQVYVLYFPTRFNQPVDHLCTSLLREFGVNTPTATSVNFWDGRDEHFGDALALFGITAPPALVLVTGLRRSADGVFEEDSTYCLSFTDASILGDRDQLISAVNLGHEVLARGDSREIARFIARSDRRALLTSVARSARAVADEVVKLKPKFGLPGGITVSVG
jgi:hypothetical protein